MRILLDDFIAGLWCRTTSNKAAFKCTPTVDLTLDPKRVASADQGLAEWNACAVLATGLCLAVSLCLSVGLSVTSRCSTKMAKRRITQTTPHDTIAQGV